MLNRMLVFYITVIGLGLYALNHRPTPHLKAPTTRAHSFTLNHAAIKRAKLFTVLISGEGFGTQGRGTGVLLDPTHILTCAHVALMGQEETLVYFYPGYILAKAHTVFANRANDLAIMELDIPVHGAPVPVFQENYADGEPITIMGNIMGCMKWFVGYGIISGSSGHFLLTDGLVKGGDSGGPWINEAGEIVAITDWGLQSAKGQDVGISGGVSAKTVNQFLKSWKNPSILDLLGVL